MTSRALNYGNYGIFLIMGNAVGVSFATQKEGNQHCLRLIVIITIVMIR